MLYLESYQVCTPLKAVQGLLKLYGEYNEDSAHKGKFTYH